MTWVQLMQVGFGQLCLNPVAFWGMTLGEFTCAVQGFAEHQDNLQQHEWERTRFLATMVLQPHARKGAKIKPHDIMVFPWEQPKRKKGVEMDEATKARHAKIAAENSVFSF